MSIDIDAIRQRGADRADIPVLLAEVERLRTELAEMKADRNGWRKAANTPGGA